MFFRDNNSKNSLAVNKLVNWFPKFSDLISSIALTPVLTSPGRGKIQTVIMVNIAEIGPASVNIIITALSRYKEEKDFLQLRDEIFLKAGQIIDEAGAKIVQVMESFAQITGKAQKGG